MCRNTIDLRKKKNFPIKKLFQVRIRFIFRNNSEIQLHWLFSLGTCQKICKPQAFEYLKINNKESLAKYDRKD